jgi:hypothetical protein
LSIARALGSGELVDNTDLDEDEVDHYEEEKGGDNKRRRLG